jgi:hypothetical protein
LFQIDLNMSVLRDFFAQLFGLNLTRYHAILIGCSIKADNTPAMKMRQSNNKNPNQNLSGVLKDLENMREFLKSRGVLNITTITPTGEERNDLLDDVTCHRLENLLVYYSGHGRESDGAWLIQNNKSESTFITPTQLYGKFVYERFEHIEVGNYIKSINPDVAESFIKRGLDSKRNLKSNPFKSKIVISDSCFSGNFISNHQRRKLSSELSGNLTVYTSCGFTTCDDSPAGGLYTLALIAKNKGEDFNEPPYKPMYHGRSMPLEMLPIGYEY